MQFLSFAAAVSAFALASPVVDLEDGVPPNLAANSTEVIAVEHAGAPALRVDFLRAEWPNIFFAPENGEAWDWSDWAGIRFHLYNPGAEPVTVAIRVDNPGDGNWLTVDTVAPPGAGVAESRFNSAAGKVFWGMRGVPEVGPLPTGPAIDLTRVSAFQLFLPRPERARTLLVTGIELFGPGASDAKDLPMPFVDRFGQYAHASWSGKIANEDELAERAGEESAALASAPGLPDRDEHLGWEAGPALEATGWFRLEEIDDEWWLVTPGGRLFWSSGVTCIATGDTTFVDEREDWFAWLPADGEPFADTFARVENAHSMAERIGGAGRVFNFYRVNLERKYGEGWYGEWREQAYARLRHWGHTTIGNWSQWSVLERSPLPFTVSGSIGGVRLLEGGSGYWQNMTDVYDEAFEEAAARAVAGPASRFKDNPLCLGYFIDNELSWEGIAEGALASPPDQPARTVFVERLKAAHGSLDALNAAWETDFGDWDAVRLPSRRNEKVRADRIAFERAFAERYFAVVQAAVNEAAPDQLYLGCRFAGPAEAHIMEAAAAHSDVISINAYYPEIGEVVCGEWSAWGRPVIIGEFHFGARDRGSFHGGLSPVESQEARAAAYARYLESALECPAVIGAHWFQFVDQPNTGRAFDGENYNIGFVDIADTPYVELVEAARDVHARMYAIRAQGGE